MTTSAMQSISMKSSDAPFTRRELAFFEGHAQNEAHGAVLTALEEAQRNGPVSKAAIARKLGVSPSQVTRWLSSPGNYESKTLGLLLAALGYVPQIRPIAVADLSRGNNFAHEVVVHDKPKPNWLLVKAEPIPPAPAPAPEKPAISGKKNGFEVTAAAA